MRRARFLLLEALTNSIMIFFLMTAVPSLPHTSFSRGYFSSALLFSAFTFCTAPHPGQPTCSNSQSQDHSQSLCHFCLCQLHQELLDDTQGPS